MAPLNTKVIPKG